jgi:predicted nucleic acid-binding protein
MGLLKELAGKKVYLDSNIFIYTVEGALPWAAQTVEVFGAIDQGKLSGTTSELSLAETLVKPFELGNQAAITAYQGIFQTRVALKVVPIARQILVEAARLRGACLRDVDSPRAKLPDAIHAATALIEGCEVILTNDRRFRAFPEIGTLYLRDFVWAEEPPEVDPLP